MFAKHIILILLVLLFKNINASDFCSSRSKSAAYREFVKKFEYDTWKWKNEKTGAELDSAIMNGVLEFSIVTRDNKGRHLDTNVRAKDLFDQMMNYYGNKVKKIEATWIVPANNALGTNYNQFLKALNDGLKPEKAVFETWTGKKAQSYGFSNVEKISKGAAGAYTVIYSRPKSKETNK